MDLTLNEKIKIKMLIKEYELNKYCEFISVSYENKGVFDLIDKNRYLMGTLSINATINKNSIKHWELIKIKQIVTKNDIIIVADEYFEVRVKLLNPIRFFVAFINKQISQYKGLDIVFYNETQNKLCIMYDDEHLVSYYLK